MTSNRSKLPLATQRRAVRSTKAVPEDATPRTGIREQVDTLRRERLLAEAWKLFFSVGYHGTTIEAIADAVEIGKPFVYRHFRTKLDLLVALYDKAIALSENALTQALEANANAEDTIRIFVRNYLQVVVHEREIVTIFFRENVNVPPKDLRRINEHKSAFDDKLCSVIQKGMKQGEFSVTDARLAMYAVVGMINWAYQWYRERGRCSPEELGDIFANFALSILDGRRPRPELTGSSSKGY